MKTDTLPGRHRILGIVALVGSALLFLFWVLYLAGVLAPENVDGPVAEFEAAFPFADGFLAVVLLAAGIGLLRGRRYGLFALAGGATATLYLGILDFTFYSSHGAFDLLDGTALVELAINSICVLGGVGGILAAWRCWGAS
jgi:hypothetical protein